MDRITKVLIFFAIIISMLVALGIIYLVTENNKTIETDVEKNNKVEKTEIDTSNGTSIDKVEKNEINENKVNTIETKSVDKTITNTAVEDKKIQVTGREEQESSMQNNQKTNEEKVLEIAKKKWGENDSNVYFNIVNHENDIYVVSVNNKNTTAVLAWYQVNVITGQVEE